MSTRRDGTIYDFYGGKTETTAKSELFCMAVHLFGAESSPACCNFELKHLADTNSSNSDNKITRAPKKGFLHCMTSVLNLDNAMIWINGSRQVLEDGKMGLHKFLSNSEELMYALPDETKASNAWCSTSWTSPLCGVGCWIWHLQIPVSVQEKKPTWCNIMPTVS